jgi:hypothetical protein
MAILTPDLNVEVYNADYRALPQIPWQQAVRLIVRHEVHVIGVRTPAVHVHSPSLVIELPGIGRTAEIRTHPVHAAHPGHP